MKLQGCFQGTSFYCNLLAASRVVRFSGRDGIYKLVSMKIYHDCRENFNDSRDGEPSLRPETFVETLCEVSLMKDVGLEKIIASS